MWRTGVAEEDVVGQEILSFLGCPFFTVKTPLNHTQKGTPYGARAHVVDRHSGGGVTRSLDLGSN